MSDRFRHWLQRTAVLGALVLPLSAEAQITRAGEASVSFTATGTGGIQIVGTTKSVSIEDSGKYVYAKVKLDKLSTGIGLRDSHMRKALETETYPVAELRVSRSALKMPPPDGEVSGQVKGRLGLHGNLKKVPFNYTAKSDGDVFIVEGTFQVNLEDFLIEPPTYLGIAVNPEVEVAVQIKLADR